MKIKKIIIIKKKGMKETRTKPKKMNYQIYKEKIYNLYHTHVTKFANITH